MGLAVDCARSENGMTHWYYQRKLQPSLGLGPGGSILTQTRLGFGARSDTGEANLPNPTNPGPAEKLLIERHNQVRPVLSGKR